MCFILGTVEKIIKFYRRVKYSIFSKAFYYYKNDY